MFEQFITSINYKKLIELQANQPAPFERAYKIEKVPKSQLAFGVKGKVKTLSRKK